MIITIIYKSAVDGEDAFPIVLPNIIHIKIKKDSCTTCIKNNDSEDAFPCVLSNAIRIKNIKKIEGLFYLSQIICE